MVALLVVVVVVGRVIMPSGSLNGGGTIIVVDLSTDEPCVKIVEPTGLVVVVSGILDPSELVVVSEIVPPGSLNGGGTIMVIPPFGSRPSVKNMEPVVIVTPDVKGVVVVPVWLVDIPEGVGETYPLGAVIGGSTGSVTIVSPPCDSDG